VEDGSFLVVFFAAKPQSVVWGIDAIGVDWAAGDSKSVSYEPR
jgi:hypothetical protein